MNSAPDSLLSAASTDPALAQLCDRIIERLQAGDAVDMATLALEHPEYADQLRRLIPAFEALVDLGISSAQHPSRVVASQHKSNATPKVLGDYRILREIGRGGMGVVYEAEQRSLNRRVALKVLPMAAALDARQFQRFQLEAQAAACLHHNNIVPVFAVGTEGGVPYYAMQYIEGRSLAQIIAELRRAEGLGPNTPEPGNDPPDDPTTTALARSLIAGGAAQERSTGSDGITETNPQPLQPAVDAKPASSPRTTTGSSTHSRAYVRTVAELGLQAAEALDHAHTRGILHRDIKPGNLILDAENRLWVADFGLAQIQGSPSLTLTGDVLGTLRYMSPEQALGKRVVVDGRTDIYSLGVTLYELLTLRPALDGKDRAEILRKIASDDTPPFRRLNPSVPIDLETIINKALDKDPAERYATAKSLADDLRAFLGNRPIQARRPSLLDRAAKWTRRHSAVVAAASVILILAVVGLATSTILIGRERSEAIRQRNFARKAVDEMYTQVAEQWLAQQPKLTGVQTGFLEKALAFYESFAGELEDDPVKQFEAARARYRVGKIHRALGKFDQAAAAFRQSSEQFQGLANRFPMQEEYRSELAFLSVDLGGLEVELGRLNEAEPPLKLAVATLETLVARNSNDRLNTGRLAVSLAALGSLYERRGRNQEAEPLLRRGLDLFERLEAKGPLNPEIRDRFPICEGDLGLVYKNTGRLAEAEQQYRSAAKRLDAWLKEEPADPRYRSTLAIVLTNLATIQYGSGRRDAARESDGRAIALLEALTEECPELHGYRGHLLVIRKNLFMSLDEDKRTDEAELVVRRAVAEGISLVNEYPDVPEYRGALASVLSFAADLYSLSPQASFHDPERAVELARRAVELRPATDGLSWQSLGWALYRTGDWKGCIESLENSSDYARNGDYFAAMAYWHLGDKAKAREQFDRFDTWLTGYEKRWKPGLYPSAKLFRRIRSEACTLLGIGAMDAQRPTVIPLEPPD